MQWVIFDPISVFFFLFWSDNGSKGSKRAKTFVKWVFNLLFDQIDGVFLTADEHMFVVVFEKSRTRRWCDYHMVVGERQTKDFGERVD